MSTPIPLLAHRGCAARYPENTREALQAAVTAGATNIEFDVQLSADQVPFLLHDEDFRRTGAVDRRIFDLDAAQAAAVAVGEAQRFGDEFGNVHVPLLADVVADLTRWPQVTAFVELKRQSIDHFGLDAVFDAVLPVIEPVVDRCVIISFVAEVVTEARKRTNCKTGWALRSWSEDMRKAAVDLAPDYLFCNVKRLPPQPMGLWRGPWTWVVYEIVDPFKAIKLAERGVGMIETMAYAELAAGLQEAAL
jgi:glycerophosphoryl diester phosphodiesterase